MHCRRTEIFCWRIDGNEDQVCGSNCSWNISTTKSEIEKEMKKMKKRYIFYLKNRLT